MKEEIAATAARIVVEEGLEYGPAKRRAAKLLGVTGKGALPDNDALETAVEDYIAVYCADSQPAELRALRELALSWLQRLSVFCPYLTGAVWRGTATRLSDIYIQLFCEDPKSAEIALIDLGVRFEVRSVTGFQGDPVDALSIHAFCAGLNEQVGVHLLVYDKDDLRGALKPDSKGKKPRGDMKDLQKLLDDRE